MVLEYYFLISSVFEGVRTQAQPKDYFQSDYFAGSIFCAKIYLGLAMQQSAPKVRSFYCLCVLERGQDSGAVASSARLNAKKKQKKTIGKNVGHKDADNKVWGDREAALCKMLGKSVGKLTKWHSMLIAAPA